MVKLNSLLPVIVSGVTISSVFIAGVPPASAITFNYNLNGTFDDGGTFSGTFSTDSDTQTITNYYVATTAGTNPAFPGFIYQTGVPGENDVGIYNSSSFYYSLANTTGGCTVGLYGSLPASCLFTQYYDGSIFAPPSSGVLNMFNYSSEAFYGPSNAPSGRSVVFGTATTQAIPEPISLVGSLVAGVFGVGLKRRLGSRKISKSTEIETGKVG